jgi:hypothetical protein
MLSTVTALVVNRKACVTPLPSAPSPFCELPHGRAGGVESPAVDQPTIPGMVLHSATSHVSAIAVGRDRIIDPYRNAATLRSVATARSISATSNGLATNALAPAQMNRSRSLAEQSWARTTMGTSGSMTLSRKAMTVVPVHVAQVRVQHHHPGMPSNGHI